MAFGTVTTSFIDIISMMLTTQSTAIALSPRGVVAQPKQSLLQNKASGEISTEDISRIIKDSGFKVEQVLHSAFYVAEVSNFLSVN